MQRDQIMKRFPWYKRFPNEALLGMVGLSLEERGAYNTILDLIYAHAHHASGVRDDHRFLARNLGCDVRVWKRIRERLIDTRKLYVEGGLLKNLRATTEIELRRTSDELPANFSEKSPRKSKPDSNEINGVHCKKQELKKKKEKKTRPSAHADGRNPLPPTSSDSFSEWDYLSDDGRVKISATEISAIEKDFPNLKNVRGLIRNAARSWASSERYPNPSVRKQRIIGSLSELALKSSDRQEAAKLRIAADTKKVEPVFRGVRP